MPESGRRHRDREDAAGATSRRHRRHHGERDHERDRHHRRKRGPSLSADALAQLNAHYAGEVEAEAEADEVIIVEEPAVRPRERSRRRSRRREDETTGNEDDYDDDGGDDDREGGYAPLPAPERRRRHGSRARNEEKERERERRRRRRRQEGDERGERGGRRESRERRASRGEQGERDTRERRSDQRRDDDRHDRHDRHDRRRYHSVSHDDDDDGDDGYDRVEVGGRADRQHRHHRDRRIPSGAVLEEGRSRGLAAAPVVASAAAAAAPAAGGGGGGGIRGFFGHLRGGFGGHDSHDSRESHDSRGSSSSSSSSRNSVEKAKAEQLYYKQHAKPGWSKKKKLVVFGSLGSAVVVLIIAVVAVVVSKKGSGGDGSGSSSSSNSSSSSGISPDSIPSGAPDWLNPFTWADTTDFNLTYTNETVGGLPVMGLNTSYDNSAAANARTAPLNKAWGSYATTPARGVNLGGWLSLEPFITPSLFSRYDAALGIVDEWTLCAHLGAVQCGSTLERHYATFVTEATFAEIAAAGLDHVRIAFSYWAVAVYDDDPYLFRTSWRYLLRGIEWARRHGLRVNLDLHGLPGSQNGWNHSGRQGAIGWLNGTDGAVNAARSLAVHDQLSQFFAQPRYAHVLSHYGLANEPRMTFLSVADVMNWTQAAAALVRRNGLHNETVIVFGDGFCGLDRWQGQPNTYNLALDVHQYLIFNNAQLVYTHAEKIRYACSGWTQQTAQSMDTATGFGPTLVAEWSQADTDCAPYLGNVGNGNRWTGTYDVGNASLDALTPRCPAQNATCGCALANADPGSYSAAYKQFLLLFAEAQMHAFEQGWGWWYWTWDTEAAPQWSYRQGLAAGILPADASQRSFACDLSAIPSFSDLPEWY